MVFCCFKIVSYVKFCVSELLQSRAFAAPFTALTLLYTLRHIQTPQTYIHFTQMHSDTSPRYLGTLQDNNRHQQTPTDTNRHQTTPTDVAKHPKRLFKDVWQFMLTSIFVCWCLMTSFTVLCCLQMSEGCLRSLSRGI